LSADVELMRQSQPAYVDAAERNLRWNFALLTLDGATFSFAITLLSETTILPAFVRSLTDVPFVFGLLAATFAVGHFLPSLFGAHLASGRVRRKPLVLAIAGAERVGILAIALSALGVGVLPDAAVLALFFLAFAFYAVTTGLIGPAYGDFMAKSIVRWRGRFYGGVQLIGGLMGFGAATIANRLLHELPYPTGVQVCFWLAFGLSFISLLFIANLREVPYPDTVPRVPFPRLLAEVPALLRTHETYRWFLLGRSVVALGTMGVGFVAVAGLQRGLTAADAAAFAAVYLLSQSIGGLVWGLVGDRWGWKLVLEGGASALATGMVVAFAASSFLAFAVAFGLLGIANAGMMTSDPNLTYEVAPPHQTSRYLGVTSTVIAPALTLAPLVGGVVAGLTSYSVLFFLSALLAVAGLITTNRRFDEPRSRVPALLPVGQPGGPV
jgi:MFS family permease